MQRIIVVFTVISCLFLSSCGKQIPGGVIKPDEMEKILYDYQRTAVMNENISFEKNYEKDLLRQSVFDKYGITEAQFDSSMVWYTRHAKELAQVYDAVEKRMENDRNELKAKMGILSDETGISMAGDTVDVWKGNTLYLLTDDPLNNKVQFSILADTNYHPRDYFNLEMNVAYIPNKPVKAIMAMNIIFNNDSVKGKTMEILHAGRNRLMFNSDSAFTIKSVNGFIYMFRQEDTKPRSMIISNIKLFRIHSKEKPIAAKQDSMMVDSVNMIKPDTMKNIIESDKKEP
ncbi:MAG: DUF4296 domain-containing protein [Phocaeicola sp.]|uniref:DUF4296 domain-containing protein n=1 Tax=Phocaeicola sp. TaxID=2773926 RepID=UPI003FA07B72